MAQTYGSQVFGPMYDVIGWVLAVGFFVYFGLGARGLTVEQREKRSNWLLNKTVCFIFAALSAVFAVGKFARWF